MKTGTTLPHRYAHVSLGSVTRWCWPPTGGRVAEPPSPAKLENYLTCTQGEQGKEALPTAP
jgi:hypothetical protein